MGREAKTLCIEGRQKFEVRAHLDGQALQLTGAKKLTLPLTQVRAATVEGEDLKIASPGAAFALRLGARQAEAWAKKILNPPSLADKLGINPGLSVALIGHRVAEIEDAVAGAAKVKRATLSAASLGATDITAVTLSPAGAEKQIAAAAKAIGMATALWLVYRKGTKPNGDEIIRLARAAGLKDTKVARISETHAALRFIRAKG
jgi:hypothetical protein